MKAAIRHARRSVLTVGMAALVLLPAAPARAQTTWTVVPSPNLSNQRNELVEADGASTDEVWAVGREIEQPATGPITTWRSLILRWNGNSWALASHPRPSGNTQLFDVDATAVGSAWAVGSVHSGPASATLIQRWNGARWSVVPSPNVDPGGSNVLLSVAAQGPRSAWAVGSNSNPSNRQSTVGSTLRWDGAQWQAVPNPATTNYQNVLQAVDGSAPDNVWAVGYSLVSYISPPSAVAIRWDGARWLTVPVPSPQNTSLYGVLALSPNDVWAVGHTFTPQASNWNAVVLHWNGTGWTRVSLPLPSNTLRASVLRDVVALSPTNIYAIGSATTNTGARNTLALHYDGATWSLDPTPNPPTQPTLSGATAIGPSTVWGVGSAYNNAVGSSRTLTIRTTDG